MDSTAPFTDFGMADLAQSAQGNTVVKAYRLSPSFIDAYRKTKFSAQRWVTIAGIKGYPC